MRGVAGKEGGVKRGAKRSGPKVETVVAALVILFAVPALFFIGAVVMAIAIAWGRYTSGL